MSPLVLVINLDRAPHRLARVVAEVERFGWGCQRVRAVDARALSARRLARLAPRPWSDYQARAITPGEIGCLASHRKAWRSLLRSGEDWALILEDDALLGDRVPDAVRAFAGQNRFDLIKLEGIAVEKRKNKGVQVLSGPPPIFLMQTVSAGAAAYCVTTAGARKLLRITHPMNREADFFIRQYGRTDLVVGEFRPFPAKQDRSESFIGLGRHAGTKPKLARKLVRAVVRSRESIMRRWRFRRLSGGLPIYDVTMDGSSPEVAGVNA